VPTCIWSGQPNLALASNYQDLWWGYPAGSEAGWGINFTHQGDTIFATWFTYDHDRDPLWLVVTAPKTAPGVYSGDLYRTTGPSFSAVPFNPSLVMPTKVGVATFTFADGNSATFAYRQRQVAEGDHEAVFHRSAPRVFENSLFAAIDRNGVAFRGLASRSQEHENEGRSVCTARRLRRGSAATFTVTTTADSGPGACATRSRRRTSPGADTITFPSPVRSHLRQRIAITSGPLTIVGLGADQLAIDGNGDLILLISEPQRAGMSCADGTQRLPRRSRGSRCERGAHTDSAAAVPLPVEEPHARFCRHPQHRAARDRRQLRRSTTADAGDRQFASEHRCETAGGGTASAPWRRLR
jgi:hypothetical protein